MIKTLALSFIYLLLVSLPAISEIAKPIDRIKLQLNADHQFRFAGYYMALEKGYYHDKGIDVNIQPANYQTDAIEELVNMRAQYAIAGSDALIAKAKGLPIVALTAINHESPLALIVKKNSNIKTLNDLKGKKIMLNETNKFAIASMLKKAGINVNEYKVLPSTASIKALDENITDAYSTYITDSQYFDDGDLSRYRYFRPKDYGLNFYNDILITTSGETTNHRFRARDFTEASLKGWEYALNNIDETIQVILKNYNNSLLSKAKLKSEALALVKIIRPVETKLGLMKTDYWQLILDTFINYGFIPSNSQLDDFVHKAEDDYLLEYLKLTPKERIWLRNNWNQIRLGVNKDWFPIEFADRDGNHAGISSDLVKRIGQDLKIYIKSAQGLTQAEALNKVKNKELDVLPASIKTKKAEQHLLFSQPYMNSDWVVISNINKPELSLIESKNGETIYSLKPLYGKSVSVTNGYISHQRLLQHNKDINLVVKPDVLSTLRDVSSGETDYAIVDLETATPLLHSYQLTNLKVNTQAFDVEDSIYFAVRNDWPELVSIINKALNYIGKTEIERIKNKWRSAPVSLGVEKSDVLIIISSAVIIILLIFIWAFTIRRAKKKVEILLQKETDLLVSNSRHIVMGEMISMLVHQWKQPLTSMMLGVNIIKMKLNSVNLDQSDKEFFDKQFNKVEDMLDEQNELISDLRNFFHPDKHKESFNLSECINGAISMIHGVIEKNSIDIKLIIDNSLELIGYERELKHVFINLIKNAADELIDSKIKNPTINIKTLVDDNDIIIKVGDNGHGIKEEILPSIFEAYVSSKALNGTGLGLYMGRLVIEEHFSGTISVHNCSDKFPCAPGITGACFTIHIPLSKNNH